MVRSGAGYPSHFGGQACKQDRQDGLVYCGGSRGEGGRPFDPTKFAPPEGGFAVISMMPKWLADALKRTADVNRCAAKEANRMSLNPAPDSFWGQTFLNNDIATLSNVVFGPERSRSALQAGISNPTRYSAAALAERAVASVPTGTSYVVSTPISHMPNTYNPVTSVEKTTTAGGSRLGRLLSRGLGLFAIGKLVFDTGVYIGALVVCSQD